MTGTIDNDTHNHGASLNVNYDLHGHSLGGTIVNDAHVHTNTVGNQDQDHTHDITTVDTNSVGVVCRLVCNGRIRKTFMVK